MKKHLAVIPCIALLFTLFAVRGFAATITSTINAVMHQNGAMYISLNGENILQYNCNSNMLHISSTNSDKKELYALFLSAASMDKLVAVTFNESTPICEVDTLEVYY